MTTLIPRDFRRGFPKSPCIRLCVLDENNTCTGCKRTLDEIIAWSTLRADEQWAVLERLKER